MAICHLGFSHTPGGQCASSYQTSWRMVKLISWFFQYSRIGTIVMIIWKLWYCMHWAQKRLFTPKIGLLGSFDPRNKSNLVCTTMWHLLARKHDIIQNVRLWWLNDRCCCLLSSRQSQCCSMSGKSPPKCTLFNKRGRGPSQHLIHSSWGPLQVHMPNIISIKSAVSPRLTHHGSHSLQWPTPKNTPSPWGNCAPI